MASEQTETAQETNLPPEPPRQMTQSELSREIEILQRELEERSLQLGDSAPTDEQRQRLHDLAARLADLREQLEAAKQLDEQKAEGTSFKARWMRVRQSIEDFTNYDVKDGMFRFQLGIRFQLDTTFGRESDQLATQVGSIDTSMKFRRGRIFAEGRILRRYDFRFEYDFAADQGLKDAFFQGAKFTRFVKWRIGHFKEPFSLNRQTSANNAGFLEWSLPVQALAPGRNWGLMFRHSEASDRLFWAVAATTNGATTDDNRSNSKITFTGRVTGLPVYKDEGRRLVHLGLGYSVRSPTDNETEFAARPEARFAPFFVDTGVFSADKTQLLGLEFAVVHDRYWVQAEWIQSKATAAEFGDPKFGGAYVEMGWFLTGESRLYQTDEAIFGRVTPNKLFHGGNPFTGKGDGGAIEITGRYSTLDLNSGTISGGEMQDVSLGLNWYLTQASRLMLNYIHSEVQDVGNADLVLIRFQFNP